MCEFNAAVLAEGMWSASIEVGERRFYLLCNLPALVSWRSGLTLVFSLVLHHHLRCIISEILPWRKHVLKKNLFLTAYANWYFLSLPLFTPRMKYIWTGHMCAVAAYGVCGTELWTPLLTTLRCNSKVMVGVSTSKHLKVGYEKAHIWLWELCSLYRSLAGSFHSFTYKDVVTKAVIINR